MAKMSGEPDRRAVGESEIPAPDVRGLLSIIVLALPVVAATAVAAMAVALVLELLSSSEYEATASIEVGPRLAESLLEATGEEEEDPERTQQTLIALAKSPAVQQAVEQRLGSVPDVAIDGVAGTELIDITASAPTAEAAAEYANAYAASVVDVTGQQAATDLRYVEESLRDRAQALERQLSNAQTTEVRTQLREQRELLVQRADQLGAAADITTGGLRIAAEAVPPASTGEGPLWTTLVVAALGGGVLGGAIVIILNLLDDRIRREESIERITRSPVLATIPPGSTPPPRFSWSSTRFTWLPRVSWPPRSSMWYRSSTLDRDRAMRRLGMILQQHLYGFGGGRVVELATAARGAYTAAPLIAELAFALAEAGKRIVIVDLDRSHADLTTHLGLSTEKGLMAVLRREIDAEAALMPVEEMPSIRVLPVGASDHTTFDSVAPTAVQLLVDELRHAADVLLFASPPIVDSVESLVLASHVDATILLVGWGATTERQVRAAVRTFDNVNHVFDGAVLDLEARP